MCDKMIDICIKYNISPNMITISRAFLLIFIYNYLFKTNKKIEPIILIIIFYFMDCLDGHLARSTNRVTKIGDILDHSADFIFLTMLTYFIYINNFKNKKIILIIYLAFLYLGLVHMGIQQLNYIDKNPNKKYEYIDTFNYLHYFDKNAIKWSRYFGCGSFIFITLLITYHVQTNKK
jgi:phosphatidylserine synthase